MEFGEELLSLQRKMKKLEKENEDAQQKIKSQSNEIEYFQDKATARDDEIVAHEVRIARLEDNAVILKRELVLATIDLGQVIKLTNEIRNILIEDSDE